ncbi:MAG: hypothetical protein ACP5E4_04265 [Candidatus Aenigmatarchaeota archaeon]
MRPEIDLIPLENIDESVIEALRIGLKERNCIVRVYAKAKLPKTALNMYRKQYNAEIIVDALKELSGNIIAITDKDLYMDKLNFVFSVAGEKGPALISIHRLKPEFYQERPNFDRLIERLLKETIYCIGKMTGLKDCQNAKCIMHRAAAAGEIDFEDTEFCKECKLNNVVEHLKL